MPCSSRPSSRRPPWRADDKPHVRPFAANFDAVSIAVPDVDGSLGCTPGHLKSVIDGAGWASFLGVVTDHQSHCINLETGELYGGEWELTDAEGDTIFGTYVLPGGGGPARGIVDLATGESSIYLGGVILFEKQGGDDDETPGIDEP